MDMSNNEITHMGLEQVGMLMQSTHRALDPPANVVQ